MTAGVCWRCLQVEAVEPFTYRPKGWVEDTTASLCQPCTTTAQGLADAIALPFIEHPAAGRTTNPLEPNR